MNDLAVMGARPRWLSLGVILEAGLELAVLERIVDSIAAKAREAGIQIVCGDTKVVERGKGDGIFINTSGVGELVHPMSPETIAPGDKIIVTGTVGDHGMALLTLRKGFPLKSDLRSDCAPLNHMLFECYERAVVKWARDATRGGVATVLNELAADRPWGVEIDEESVPLSDATRGVSELLGLDPLYSANEGKAVLIVPAADADAAVRILRDSTFGRDAAVIGEIATDHSGKTVLKTRFGIPRTLGVLASDPLPRIC